MTSIASIG